MRQRKKKQGVLQPDGSSQAGSFTDEWKNKGPHVLRAGTVNFPSFIPSLKHSIHSPQHKLYEEVIETFLIEMYVCIYSWVYTCVCMWCVHVCVCVYVDTCVYTYVYNFYCY